MKLRQSICVGILGRMQCTNRITNTRDKGNVYVFGNSFEEYSGCIYVSVFIPRSVACNNEN